MHVLLDLQALAVQLLTAYFEGMYSLDVLSKSSPFYTQLSQKCFKVGIKAYHKKHVDVFFILMQTYWNLLINNILLII